ncbi:hypothetical protein NMG60_11022999, partial [Bertholletia excelsa]
VISADAPSNYHVAARTENSSQVPGAPSVIEFSMTAGAAGAMDRKKKGRPRRYGPGGSLSSAPLPNAYSSSAPPPSTGGFWPRSGVEQRQLFWRRSGGGLLAFSAGTNFLTHVINVDKGEDISMKLISFAKEGSRAICVLSANGAISNATIRQDEFSGATLTYEGIFDIVNLQGSFIPVDVGAAKSGSSGGLSVTFLSPDGRLLGGALAGLLTAAGPVQVLMASFLPNDYQQPKPKKRRMAYKPTPNAPESTPPTVSASVDEGHNTPKQSCAAATNFNPVQSSAPMQNCVSMDVIPDPRSSSADINISLQGE